MVAHIKKIIFHYRLNRAINKANHLRNLTGYRYYVMLYKGKPRIYAKKDLKEAFARKRFIKGFKPEHLDRVALYKTY